jgi:Mrp family chromosome partitioning ATPase
VEKLMHATIRAPRQVARSPLEEGMAGPIPPKLLDHARRVGLSLLRTIMDRPGYVLGITSALPGEGKSAVSLGLAEVMAADFGLSVVLLDAHAERPWAPHDESFAARPGLSDWVSGEMSLDESRSEVHENYALLPFGQQAMSSRDMLQHMVRVDALQQLRDRHHLVIMDLPDLRNPAAAALANACDGIVLVIRAGVTPAESIGEYLPTLHNVVIHGVVLNQHRPAVPAAIQRLFA